MGKKKLQTTPFKITLNRHGSFEAIASEGIIRPKTKKAKETMYNPATRESVEVYAFAYLGRRNWKWEIPDGMPELQDGADAPSETHPRADG